MIDADSVRSMLSNLDEYVGYLRQLAALPRDEVLGDFARVGAMRYYLQTAIQCSLDLANHIISSESLREPRDYADAFVVLGEAGIVPAELVPTLRQMAGLRNRIAHLYWQVDNETLYQIVTTDLGDFDRFRRCVLALLPS